MAYNKLPKLPTWAEDVTLQPLDLTQPTDPQIKDGFVRTPTPPKRPWFNWFFNRIMSGLQYLTRRGIADWDTDEEYLTKDKVTGSNGKTYIAIVDNSGQNPVSSPTYWMRWGYTAEELLDAMYPVGTPYFNKIDTRNPTEIFGFGVWVRETGFLAGLDPDATDGMQLLGGSGGAKGVKMTLAMLIEHGHKVKTGQQVFRNDGDLDASDRVPYNYEDTVTPTNPAEWNTSKTGNADPAPIPTIPPYTIYNWWVRTE